MNILIDTCVVMDFLQNREPFAVDAKSIFRAAAKELFSGYITAKAATDIYYLTHRCTHSDTETRKILNQLFSLIELLDTEANDIIKALSSPVSDFEDAVMIETAVRTHVDYLVTRNSKDYKKSTVPVLTPVEFLNLL